MHIFNVLPELKLGLCTRSTKELKLKKIYMRNGSFHMRVT